MNKTHKCEMLSRQTCMKKINGRWYIFEIKNLKENVISYPFCLLNNNTTCPYCYEHIENINQVIIT